MPAARQRSRSPCMACAVSATSGSRRSPSFSRSRIACAASNPPISGIWRSISTRSNGALADASMASTASRPFSTALTSCPRFRSSVVTSLRLTGLSSATRTWSGRSRRAPTRSTAGSALSWRTATPKRRVSASSRSECLIGLVSNASMSLSLAPRRCRLAGRPTSASRWAASPGASSRRTRRASMKPSTSGIWQSEIITSKGAPAPTAA